MDTIVLAISMLAFFALVVAWLVLPASASVAEPSRIRVPRASSAEA